MKKIVLLNPPGERFYMRDYYCSKISKAAYYNHPVDFIILSGTLSGLFDLEVIDCIAERLSVNQALARVTLACPDIVIFLSGAVSMDEDFFFLIKVRKSTCALMIGAGDIFLEHSEELLEKNSFIDAALLNFSTDDAARFIQDITSDFNNVIYRDGHKIVKKACVNTPELFDVPMPRHELFRNDLYSFPFLKPGSFATVLTDFGCPFPCAYCAVNRFGYKKRTIRSVIGELKYLNSIGLNQVFFKDQTFTADYERVEDMCRAVNDNGIKINWTCFSRVDTVDEALLKAMKDSGCGTIIFGLESFNQELLSQFGRLIDVAGAKKIFSACRRFGISTVGTFILGLPGEDEKSLIATITASKTIGCDYASFNIFTPAYGTKIREWLIKESKISGDLIFMDSGISQPVMGTGFISKDRLRQLHRQAVFSFYARPEYIIGCLKGAGNVFQFFNLIRQGIGTLKNICG